MIRNTVNRAENIIYIDKGSEDGIRQQMGVINQQGVVGQVIQVTPHYAAVMSLLHQKFTISAKLKSTNYFGNLNWDGLTAHTATLSEIPKHVQMNVGDSIVTSGYSQLFPVGIMVGTIKSVNRKPDSNFAEVTVKLAANFNNLTYVYVIENMRREELVQLDSLSKSTSP